MWHAIIRGAAVLLGAAFSLLGCPSSGAPSGLVAIRLEKVADSLSNPLYLTAPAGDGRLFIVEQPGRVRIVKDGLLLPTPFLDITGLVSSGGERGLLSIAFHPAYASNGFFYVNYTDANGDTQVSRYTVSPNPDAADASSAKSILRVDQPYSNHNGGLLLFGPDGMLYIGMGDGGSGGDPLGNAQNKNSLLGKLLRIDVNGGDPYAIPAGNPFMSQSGARAEIWALGLRNPWRFAFDWTDDMLYIADVGQNRWEEIDAVPALSAGLNYGWNILEGSYEYAGTDPGGLTDPVLEYGHDEGCSITGGFVYRGSAIPSLTGHYFYADYCQGWVRSFKFAGGAVSDQSSWELGNIGRVLSFGEDSAREMYILSGSGSVYRVVKTD